MSKVSIIIPVYNTEKYLSQCLDSVLSQSFADWECILVDDGSSDRSGKICDEYVTKDSRFRVIHKENGGVSSARNLGISEAKSEYICFLDSDDRMKKNHLEISVKKIKDADLLIFGYERFNGRTDKRILETNEIDGFAYCHDYLYSLKENAMTSEFFCFPWNKLYRRSLIVENKISFPEDISMREDEIFSYRYLPYVKKIVSISDILIEYNDAGFGLSAKKLNPEKSIRLARYLILQTECDNSEMSKMILFFRAMIYMADAIVNLPSLFGKKSVAKEMITIYKNRSFVISDNQIKGHFRKSLIVGLEKKSILRIIFTAYYRKFCMMYQIYIQGNKDLKRWGTNV